jgi:hypothetical protein
MIFNSFWWIFLNETFRYFKKSTKIGGTTQSNKGRKDKVIKASTFK